MTAVITQISLTQLQFTGSDDTANKLRRLVTELVNAEKAINALIGIANGTTNTPTTVPKHELADTTGLGPSHTTSGLKVGEVLRAIGPTDAAFEQLKFSDLYQSDIQNPEQNNIIIFNDGYWVAGDISDVTGSTGMNLGMGVPVYVDNDVNTLRFRTLAPGTAIDINLAAEEITISVLTYTETEAGAVPAPGTADHSQILFDDGWAVLAQVHVYFGVGAPATLENDGDLYFDTTNPATYQGYVQDAGAWVMFGGSSGGGGGSGSGFTQVRGGTFTAGTHVITAAPDIPLVIPNDCVISKVVLLTEGGAGSCVIDIFKAPFGGTYPPTASICAADLPTITAGVTYSDTTLTGWTTALSADDVLLLHVDSSTVFTSIGVFLYLQIPKPLMARGATFTGGAVPLTTTPDVTVIIPEGCTIEKVVVLTEGGPSSCVLDIFKSSFGAYPPTTSICAADKPTITAGKTYEDSTLTGWTTALNADDVLGFHLVSTSTFTSISITLYLRPT